MALLRDPWAEDVTILSAENVRFGVETAGLGSRFGAALIDVSIQLGVIAVMTLCGALLVSNFPLDNWSRAAINIGQAAYGLLVFAVLWGYYVAFEWLWDGQTPGKRALGLRVLHADGMPLTPWGALVRNIVRVFDFLPVMYGVGAILAVINPNHRRAGDLVAGTIVARERHDASRPVLTISQAADAFLAAQKSPRPTPDATSTPLQVLAGIGEAPIPATSQALDDGAPALETLIVSARLGAGDFEMLDDFLQRRAQLKPLVRARLSQRLAAQLSAKLQQEMPPSAQLEAWLETLAARR